VGLSLSSKGKGLVADLLGRQVSLQVSARMGGFNTVAGWGRPSGKKGARLALNNNSRGLLFHWSDA